jgi:YegS/Rv2252/BmrU family lipid kinase
MTRKLVFLVNPISGTGKKDVLRQLIEQKTDEADLDFEIIPTNVSGNYDFLKDKIAAGKITDVIIVGGDGSVGNVISALRDEKVQFGILPTGSGNGLAYCAGISKSPVRALQTIFKGHSTYVDAFKVNDEFSCMLSGLGFDAHVAHQFANSASRGLLTYTQQSLYHYFKAHPYQFEIILDNFSFYSEAFLISIANSNQFGNHFMIAPKASLNDGLLDIVVVQKMNKARLPFAIFRQIRGNNKLQHLVDDVTNKNILYFQTASLIIKNLKHAPFHVDGEPRQSVEEFKIDIIPRCFKLIQPA